MKDQLICGTCRGEKVVRKRIENLMKVDICPRCRGTGTLMSEIEWRKDRGKKLIKG